MRLGAGQLGDGWRPDQQDPMSRLDRQKVVGGYQGWRGSELAVIAMTQRLQHGS
jgi:hypothetical protein